MDDFHARPRWEISYQKLLKRIEDNGLILPENKKLIRDFVVYLKARGSMPATVWRHVYSYEKLLNSFDPGVSVLNATREDAVKAVAEIEGLKLNELTKAKTKATLKFLFKHFKGDDIYYPREIAWIRTTVKKESKLMPSDLLTEGDVSKLIDNARNLRDIAIIALLADAPIRTHELLLLRRKNLVLDVDQPFLIIPEDTKTGTRRIPLINSIPYLVQYVNAFKNLRMDDPLFMHELWNEQKRPLHYAALRMMLKKVAARAGITKRVYPYLFRHTVITRYANKLSNAQLEKIAGWTHGTDMHMTYEHLSDLDVSNAVARANGLEVRADEERVKPRIKVCGRCKYTNPMDSMYCARCGGALGVEIALQEDKDKELFDEALSEYLKDPKHFEELAHKVLMEDYRKKGRM